jgi:hypothetical protein
LDATSGTQPIRKCLGLQNTNKNAKGEYFIEATRRDWDVE